MVKKTVEGGGITKEAIIWVLILAMLLLWGFGLYLLQQWRRERESLEAYKLWIMRKAKENVEQRCQHCHAGKSCPGYNTGVIYPCEYYKEHGYEKEM